MAVTTNYFSVAPSDGWTLVATAPSGPILLKPHATGRAWFLAVQAALPGAGDRGIPMGRFSGSGEDNQFRTDNNLATENIYVRVPAGSVAQVDAEDNKMLFSILHG